MASETTVFIPSNGENIIQTAPGLSSVALQTSGATSYPQYGAQQIPTSAPQQVPQNGPLETFLKAEPKVLGAVQILIGLIHIGFGAVSLASIRSSYYSYSYQYPFSSYYLPLCAIGGYPFWGGIFFISSGSLCVAAANNSSHGLVKSSVGMNITCALMALAGIFVYIAELIINNDSWRHINQYAIFRIQGVSYGISCVLLLFSVLEFCITVSLAHFGCQAACCIDAQPTMIFMPFQVFRGGAVAAAPNPAPLPPPPTYNDVDTKPQ